MKKLIALFAASVVAGYAIAAFAGSGQKNVLDGTALEPGRCETVTTTAENALPTSTSRRVWCLYADDGNTDELRFKLGATATTAAGFVLNAGSSYCDPVGDDTAWMGRVSVIAESGTQNYCVLAY